MEQTKEEFSMKELLEQEGHTELHVHDHVKGEVVRVTDKYAKINLNTFTEGTIYLDHFTTDKNVESLRDLIKVGDIVEAEVTKISENTENSEILLSRLNTLKNEDFVQYKEQNPVESNTEAKVIKIIPNKGYILTNGKIEMFMSVRDLKDPLAQGDKVVVKIINYDDTKHNAFVSRYAVIREERQKAYEERQKAHEEYLAKKEEEHQAYLLSRDEELQTFKPGDVVTGVVANIVPYGAFVKFDKVQGLIRLKEVDHTYIKSAADIISVGEEVTCKVLSIENGKLELSRKALLKTPFQLYVENHAVSDTIRVKVANKMPFGVLCEVAPHVTGLLHKSEFSWNPNDNLMASLHLGDEIEVAIIAIDSKNEKISLSRRALIDNPWAKVEGKVGDKVEAKITEVLERGFKVEALGVDGFIPFNMVLVENRNMKATDLYSVGDTINGIVVELDAKKWILTISEKALKEQEERAQFENYMNDSKEEKSTTLGDLFKDQLK